MSGNEVASRILDDLEKDGFAEMPALLEPHRLSRLQEAFSLALDHPSWNTWRGYEQTEKWRLVIEDVLSVDPAAYDVALHPVVMEAIRRYVGQDFALVEARGWRTIKCHGDFHGWHQDAWAHPTEVALRPREIKLGIYLTDVTSGHFAYIAGSHKVPDAPKHWPPVAVDDLPGRRIHAKGAAGTAFLFDTWGVHRQTAPVLEPRDVIFFNYHDASVRLQDLDTKWGRYRPLMLNAGMIPTSISPEEMRILGFGVAAAVKPGGAVPGRPSERRFALTHAACSAALGLRLEIAELQRQSRRVTGRLRRAFSRPG